MARNAFHDFSTFDAILHFWAKERPDGPAFDQDGRVTSYAEADDLTRRLIALMQARGIDAGDRVAWLGKNRDIYFLLYIAAARMGAVMVPIGWRLAPREIAYILTDTEAKLVFADADFVDVAHQVASEVPANPEVIEAEAARMAASGFEPADYTPPGPHDPVLQLYTSGTTGNPKGAMLSNTNLLGLRNAGNEAGLDWQFYEPIDCMLVAMPCAHIGGTGLGIMALASGLPGLVQAEFSPDAVFDAIEKGGATRLFIVPAALQMMVNHPRCRSVDYSRLKYILYGAAPIPLELLRQSMDVFNAQFIQVYGMTETTGTICMLPPEDHDPNGNKRMRSAGKPLPGVDLRIVDGAGNDMPVGEVGEVWTRSSNNMIGYWNLPDATKGTVADGGWIKTGDAGYLDEDGYLYIHDRVKDMIITGGENVYPAEVESAIYGHPDVLEVAVIGVPDAKWGEAVKAVCVPKPGAQVDVESVIAWARERIAGFKVPRSVDVIEALPRNASGKILRKDLRAPYWAGYDRQVN